MTERRSAALGFLIEFHTAGGLPMLPRPGGDVAPDVARLRAELLLEEAAEFAKATADGDIVALADALADVVYVAYGAAVTYGIDLDAALREVHRSNMSKVDGRERPVQRADGKVLKPAHYSRPDISRVLALQRPLPVPELIEGSAGASLTDRLTGPAAPSGGGASDRTDKVD